MASHDAPTRTRAKAEVEVSPLVGVLEEVVMGYEVQHIKGHVHDYNALVEARLLHNGVEVARMSRCKARYGHIPRMVFTFHSEAAETSFLGFCEHLSMEEAVWGIAQ